MTHAPDWPLVDTTFAVLDLETSGGSPRSGAAITEIGVVKVRGGQVLGTFKTFVDPGHPLPIFITELTGITELNSGITPKQITVKAGDKTFSARLRIDTPGEADYYRHGGIMQYVLRSLLA